MSVTDCLVTMMTDLVKDYLIKICTLLTRLFPVLIVSTLKFSTCLCWGYLIKNCTYLAWISSRPACTGTT